jgi:hypothetical protein
VKSFCVHYKFSQHFDFSPRTAYNWCTDYQPSDINLGGEKGMRSIRWINDGALVLTDTYFRGKSKVVKKRLVKLFPEILTWTNTRISSEGRYSQFLYQIVPEPGGSRLLFTGNQIFAGEASASRRAAMAKRLASEDAGLWRKLSRAMSEDLAN